MADTSIPAPIPTATYPFTFEGVAVRVVMRGDDPWFVLADVCKVLNIGNPSMSASRLDDDEKGISTVDTPSGAQDMVIINESGLYSMTLTSRKPAARRLKKWITADVLPAIRKTGSYGAIDPMLVLNDPKTLRQLLASYSERVETLEAKVEILAPKADGYDRIAGCDGSMSITDAAKSLQMRPKELFSWLRANGWIYERFGKAGSIAYQDKIQAGYLEHKVTTVSRSDGSEQVRVTASGLTKLAKVHSPAFRTGAISPGIAATKNGAVAVPTVSQEGRA